MKRFKNILCVVERGKISKPAVERAVAMAEHNQAKLTIVAVIERITAGIGIPGGGLITADLQAALVDAHTQELARLIEPYRKKIEIHTKVLKGVHFLEIIREVLRNEYDLVIKVPDAHNWLDHLFGSDDMHLLRKCPCPVWLIKPEKIKTYNRIMVAVDVDDSYPPAELKAHHTMNHQLLEMASSLALSEEAELHIVSVWDAIGESMMSNALAYMPEDRIKLYTQQVQQHYKSNMNALIRDAMNNLDEEASNYLKPIKHLVKGLPHKEIPALAKRINPDILIMATIARTGIPGFIMGNTAETIINQIACSLIAIKPSGFVTPVTIEN